MLSANIVEKLNEQVNLEMYSSNIYLAMSAWCANKGLKGSADFLKRHSKEELGHAYKLFDYINEAGENAKIGAIVEPKNEFDSMKDVFKKTYEHELVVSKSIFELVDFALSNKDYSTFNFLQWYVAEQHEEEKLFKEILDKIDMVGTEGRGLFMLDKEIGQLGN